MPGFFVGNMGDVSLENEFDERCLPSKHFERAAS